MERVAFNKASRKRSSRPRPRRQRGERKRRDADRGGSILRGLYAYGGYPDIDGLFREQAARWIARKREAILHKIQQLMHRACDVRALFAPQRLARASRSGLGLISSTPSSSVRGHELKAQ